MNLVTVGVSHRTAPLALRERVGLSERQAAAMLASLTQHSGIDEAASVSTCNRIELYLAATDGGRAETAAADALASVGGETIRGAIRTLRGAEAARHLFCVAAGLDSMVLGEAEIQGQVKRSYELALSLGTGGPMTNRLFQAAIRAGKRVRSETGVSRHAASVASVSVELARSELGDLRGRSALVIGTGKHGTLTAMALREAGVRTAFVASRHYEHAADLARRFAGAAVDFSDLASELGRCDLVLTCTSCPYRVLTRADLVGAARGRRLVIVDTAVPRDVDPAARELPGVTLYDLDDVQRSAERNLVTRAQEAKRAEPIIDEEVAHFGRWLASLDVVPTISALRQRGTAAVDRALRENESRWRALTAEDRARVELLAHAVVSDLLHEPTLRLRQAGERGTSALYSETLSELFGLGA
ncbi:MAG: glutamyl-tRNA reductase [Thermoleophilaceae bacterium]